MNEIETSAGERVGGRVATIGILAILAGIFALMFPQVVTFTISVGVGVLLAVGGAMHLWELGQAEKRSWLAIIVGIAYLAVGAVFILRPLTAALSLTLTLGILLILSGAFRMAAAISGEVAHRRFLVAISGLCSIALGWMAIRHLPSTSVWILGLIAGVDMLFDGIALFGVGRRTRKLARSTTEIPVG